MSNNSSNPSKASGQMHAAKGSVKETLGATFGATHMKHEGAQEHRAGVAEKDAAKAQNYAEGTGDRMTGKKDQVVGSLTGDRSQQHAGDMRHKKGEIQQDMNKF
ncbi:hypothetical protein BKA70DRAFT_1226098 [Coprinopsis sp. MPI-PUGE-AT-0042]|nr:hypothetical protein BKA70DRAFT_1226098 [Coprinopsis sp. MPI-PUGE-AT-0042]